MQQFKLSYAFHSLVLFHWLIGIYLICGPEGWSSCILFYMTTKLNIWSRLGQLSHCIPVENVVDVKVGTRNQGDQWELSCDFSCWELRESNPRQVDKKSRVPEKEKGVWGSQRGDRGVEI